MKRTCSIALLLLALLPVAAFGQSQQVIHLKDGSSVTGEIINQDENKLLVQTEYGTLEIPKANVQSIGYCEAPKPAIETMQSVMPAAPMSPPQSAQRDAASKGGVLVRGGLQYVGTPASEATASSSQITMNPSVAYFTSRGSALGFDVGLTRSASEDYALSVITFGLNGTALLGEMNGSLYFHFVAGVGLFNAEENQSGESASVNGTYVKFALGATPVVMRHLGIPIEVEFMAEREGSSGTVSTSIGLGAALEGFIFK